MKIINHSNIVIIMVYIMEEKYENKCDITFTGGYLQLHSMATLTFKPPLYQLQKTNTSTHMNITCISKLKTKA